MTRLGVTPGWSPPSLLRTHILHFLSSATLTTPSSLLHTHIFQFLSSATPTSPSSLLHTHNLHFLTSICSFCYTPRFTVFEKRLAAKQQLASSLLAPSLLAYRQTLSNLTPEHICVLFSKKPPGSLLPSIQTLSNNTPYLWV